MKPITTLCVFVFMLVAILQAVRFLAGWDLAINGYSIPGWASGVASLAAASLAFLLWRESRARR